MKPVVSVPNDDEARRRFVETHDRNISVIAPAGVGKTRGIVDRILQLARNPRAEDLLPRLVVVTFSVAAAQEMQSRARTSLRGGGLPRPVQRAFQQTFFGTIHSFCVRLLGRFGPYLGLPGALRLPASEDELWERFLVHGARRDPAAEPALRDLFYFFTVAQLYGLGRTVAPADEIKPEAFPRPDLCALLAFPTTGLAPATRKAVHLRQEALAGWEEAWVRGDRYHALPTCCENPPAFVELWRDTFAPLQAWLRRGALEFGRCVANDFAAFRRREGVMTYHDQVRLALAALRTPAAREELRRERWSVLLDEAQDTDRDQFEVLARVAGLPPGAPDQAPGQTFCIVGDFQQAIWAPRSDLDVYQAVHVEMVEGPAGLAIELTVTFRCDRAIIEFVNRFFPPLLDGAAGQAKFVPLQARTEAGSGQVVRWFCPDLPASDRKISTGERARHEAHFLAAEVARLGPAGLGTERWQDVAILCPRRDWLRSIESALRQAGVKTQLHSGDESQAGSTPRAWLTALVWVAAYPEDAFEVAGVLRDIFGVADDAMALFTGGNGELLRLDRPARSETGEVAAALALLGRACAGAETLPLHRAVRQLLERTRLRNRIVSLQEEQADLVERDLAVLRALADERASEGMTLRDFARELRESLDAAPAGEEVREAVQLFTYHKAKGLEWPTVIVPFVFRSFGEKEDAYPRVVHLAGAEAVYRDQADYKENARARVRQRAAQQFQRLLYVACTRARHTLLFLHDESVFAGAERESPYAAARLLGLEREETRAAWDALPDRIERHDRPATNPPAMPELIPPYPPLSRADAGRAVRRAQRIPRRVAPHELAQHPPPEAEPERAAQREEPPAVNPAILYGTWWHGLMERVPWAEGPAAWSAVFAAALPGSPQPDRAVREWEILRASPLARWLATPGLVVHRELPFLWPTPDRCLEGVVDLAVFSPADESWHVLDWKTNRTDRTGLLAIYRGQIEAYVQTLEALLQAPVRGGLYLTATGEWIEVARAEDWSSTTS